MDRALERRVRSPLSLFGFTPEDLLSGPAQGPTPDGFLAADIYETPNSFVVRVAVPGLAADEIKVTRVGDTLTLEGELKVPEKKNATYLFRERSYGKFSRTLPLPEGAQNEVNATLENGILTLEFAKPTETVARTIQVKAAKK